MQLPKIRTFNGNHSPNSFYVLCKGENSGKPLREPCPNCFCVTPGSEDEFNYWFWLSWGLWKSKSFHYYLRGSVIPFIRICDYEEAISKASANSCGSTQLSHAVKSMQDIEARETCIRQQLKLLADLKIAIFRQYIHAHPFSTPTKI